MGGEAHISGAGGRGGGLFFRRTQAATQAPPITADQLLGEWTLLKEFEKPLCKLTLSNAAAGGENIYKLTVKPGCDAEIADVGLSTWRLDRHELVRSGLGGAWPVSGSDPPTSERIPPTTTPPLLVC